MAVTPTGNISIPMATLRTMVSESSSFQTWVGAASASLALPSVYMVGVTGASVDRPFALVSSDFDWDSGAIGGSPGNLVFIPHGNLFLDFEDDIAVANQSSYSDSLYAFMNNVGAVISDLWTASGSSERLLIQDIARVQGPERSEPREKNSDQGDTLWTRYRVEWGLR